MSMKNLRLALAAAALPVLVPACTAMELHGADYRAACARSHDEGCPCFHANDCNSLWCANGECARREP